MLNLLFYPFGAIRRLPFLFGLLFSVFLVGAAMGLIYAPAVIETKSHSHNYIAIMVVGCYLLGALTALASFWISLCLHLKRLYDLRVPRLLVLIPLIGGFADKYAKSASVMMAVQCVILLYVFALLFWPSRR